MDALWQRLKGVTQMTLEAEYAGALWAGQGCVDVHTLAGENQLVFQEEGAWHATRGHVQPFINQYVWAFDFAKHSFSLHRKRAEAKAPELLARFIQNVACHTQALPWKQAVPHLCGEDCYKVALELAPSSLSLNWRIHGPEKRDQVRITYF